MTRHLLSAADLSRAEAEEILDEADRLQQALMGREVKKLPTLRGRTVMTVFYENSTRTRVSFEVAGKWMSADVINVSASGSSVAKGESLRDTALTLHAAGADALIVRHPASGAAQQIAAWTHSAAALNGLPGPVVINAGDGMHEHPTQALLDALTLRQRLGGIEGRRIVIVGDVLHSRVARSNALLLSTLGAEVVLVAPRTLLPVGVETWPVTVADSLEAELPGADAVMMLRVQAERMNGGFFPSEREYSVRFGLNPQRAALLPDHAVVLHPGPMLRGMEIGYSVADSAQAAILQQVNNGVHVRMAVLFHLLATEGVRNDADPPRCHPHLADRRRPRMSLLLTNVRPYGEGEPVDVAIAGGEILAIGAGLTPAGGAEVIDGGGNVLLPGFVDLHTHLREPGREDTETIESGSAAAALGGYTAVFAMANTSPVADSAVVTDHVYRRGQEVGLVDVHPVGAVTVGLQGEKLAEMGMMAAGPGRVRVFSDDGVCVSDPLLMRRALEYSASLGVVIAQHAEEPRLTKGAVAHEGPEAARLGLAGWPRAAEEAIVARDALLARDAGARVHICHASTAGTVELLKWAKEQGIAITAEVTPHHLLLDDSRLQTYDAVNRVNPPLREASDVAALRKALRDGVIDCVATDHAPHAEQDKCCEFAAARPGMLGLETALAIVAQVSVETGDLGWRDVARVMSEKPAQIARLDDQGRPIGVGEPANLTLVDPDLGWTVRADELASRSRNTPFAELSFRAKPVLTVLRGRVTARDGVAAQPETGARA